MCDQDRCVYRPTSLTWALDGLTPTAMSLNVGSRLGSYSVAAKIGEGGMGEVYQARDTKLDRDVAFKVLPQVRWVQQTLIY